MILSDLTSDNVTVNTSLKCTYLSQGLVSIDATGKLVNASSLNIVGASFTPTISNQTGISLVSSGACLYSRVVNSVEVSASFSITNLLTASTFDITVPVAPSANFTTDSVVGMGTTYNTALTSVGAIPIVSSVNGTQTVRVRLPGLSLGTWVVKVMFTYLV